MHIYVVNGYPGSGKTTFEGLVEEICGPARVYIYSTITPIIDAASKIGLNISDWKKNKTQKDRAFLSELKALANRYYDFSMKHLHHYLESIRCEVEEYWSDPNEIIVFIDSREPNEIERICEEFGAKSILIKRENHEAPMNTSDANVLKYKYDIVIDNNGSIGDLKRKIIMFLGEELIG